MNSKHGLRVLATALSFALFAVGRPLGAQTSPSSNHGAQSGALMRIVAADRTASRVQSVIFGAWIGTSPLLTTALGDSLTGVPATTAMHIRAGIVETEALNTILVKLADERRTLLDAPLSTWFPAFPRAKDVTLRMLGNNRSGYGDYLADTEFLKRLNDDPFHAFSTDELIAIGMRQKMPFRPGAGFFYAHTNAVLLGAALQRITGRSIAELFAECVAGPLQLDQTVIPVSANVADPAQHLFYRDRGPFEDSTFWNPSWASFSGTIVSTIADVATMQRAFGSGRLVSKPGLAAILAPTNATSPPQTPDDLTIVVSTAISFGSAPAPRGYSLLFFNDAAAYLAPERPVPSAFTKS
jgi:D-alanyl-D-alanine carboxypeptidase